ncbi:MAG: hypothetical protein HOV87_33355 [Catenulispora sp.]|nr:hypothetical protein [Catenulispora sp.]
MGIRLTSAGALSAATAAVLFTALAVPAVAAAGPASAAALPLTGFSSIVADSTHHHVFVSGAGSDPVAVADFGGQPVGQLASLGGATALALSQGDGILYAAIGGTDEIAAVNTSTLQEVALYFTGTGHDPRHLAVVGHDVWFSYGASGNSGIGVLDPTALTVATTSERTFYNAAVLAASPSAPHILVAGDGGISPSVVESFNVSTGAPVPIAESNPGVQPDGCENLSQLAVTADGASVVTACGWPYHGSQLTLSGMTENAVYQTGSYLSSVAVAPANGTIAFGAYATSPSVSLFLPGTSTPTSTYQLSGFGVYGLAWNQSGSELFAVSTPGTPSSSTPTLNVINVS